MQKLSEWLSLHQQVDDIMVAQLQAEKDDLVMFQEYSIHLPEDSSKRLPTDEVQAVLFW